MYKEKNKAVLQKVYFYKTGEETYSRMCIFDVWLIKQFNGCPMGGAIFVVISDIYVCKMEEDIVIPATPIFYKRYADDNYLRRKKNETDKLSMDLNSYHESIKLTLEIKLKNLLDAEIISTDQEIKTQVYIKTKRLPVHCSSKVPIQHKRNAIMGKMHRAKRIASDSDKEIKRITNRYTDKACPKNVIENTIKNFNTENDELIIPPWLFDERQQVTIR